jgi:hypothetical protein
MRIGSLLIPTTYTIDCLRQMMFRDPAALVGGDPTPLWLCWVVVLAFAAIGVWLAYAAFMKPI